MAWPTRGCGPMSCLRVHRSFATIVSLDLGGETYNYFAPSINIGTSCAPHRKIIVSGRATFYICASHKNQKNSNCICFNSSPLLECLTDCSTARSHRSRIENYANRSAKPCRSLALWRANACKRCAGDAMLSITRCGQGNPLSRRDDRKCQS